MSKPSPVGWFQKVYSGISRSVCPADKKVDELAKRSIVSASQQNASSLKDRVQPHAGGPADQTLLQKVLSGGSCDKTLYDPNVEWEKLQAHEMCLKGVKWRNVPFDNAQIEIFTILNQEISSDPVKRQNAVAALERGKKYLISAQKSGSEKQEIKGLIRAVDRYVRASSAPEEWGVFLRNLTLAMGSSDKRNLAELNHLLEELHQHLLESLPETKRSDLVTAYQIYRQLQEPSSRFEGGNEPAAGSRLSGDPSFAYPQSSLSSGSEGGNEPAAGSRLSGDPSFAYPQSSLSSGSEGGNEPAAAARLSGDPSFAYPQPSLSSGSEGGREPPAGSRSLEDTSFASAHASPSSASEGVGGLPVSSRSQETALLSYWRTVTNALPEVVRSQMMDERPLFNKLLHLEGEINQVPSASIPFRKKREDWDAKIRSLESQLRHKCLFVDHIERVRKRFEEICRDTTLHLFNEGEVVDLFLEEAKKSNSFENEVYLECQGRLNQLKAQMQRWKSQELSQEIGELLSQATLYWSEFTQDIKRGAEVDSYLSKIDTYLKKVVTSAERQQLQEIKDKLQQQVSSYKAAIQREEDPSFVHEALLNATRLIQKMESEFVSFKDFDAEDDALSAVLEDTKKPHAASFLGKVAEQRLALRQAWRTCRGISDWVISPQRQQDSEILTAIAEKEVRIEECMKALQWMEPQLQVLTSSTERSAETGRWIDQLIQTIEFCKKRAEDLLGELKPLCSQDLSLRETGRTRISCENRQIQQDLGTYETAYQAIWSRVKRARQSELELQQSREDTLIAHLRVAQKNCKEEIDQCIATIGTIERGLRDKSSRVTTWGNRLPPPEKKELSLNRLQRLKHRFIHYLRRLRLSFQKTRKEAPPVQQNTELAKQDTGMEPTMQRLEWFQKKLELKNQELGEINKQLEETNETIDTHTILTKIKHRLG